MKHILGLFFLFWVIGLFGQTDSGNTRAILQYSISFHKASILIHNKELRVVDNSYPNGLQLDFAWQQRSRESWEKCHCFPKLGFSLILWDYDSPDILGNGLSALFFIEPEYGANNKLSFSVKAGFGLSYLSNPYHETDNMDNRAYSTSINFALYLAAKSGLKLNDQSKLNAAFYFHHNSNGGVKSPNRGLNYPSFSLGYSRYIKAPDFQSYAKKSWNKSEAMKRLDLSLFVAWKKVEKGVHLFSPGIELKGSKQVGKINALTGGLEYLHDNFLKYDLEQRQINSDYRKLSVAIGHEFLLGKLVFSQQLGAYIYKQHKEGADVYQRYGLNYAINKWLALGVNLQVHTYVAYLADYRLVFSFR